MKRLKGICVFLILATLPISANSQILISILFGEKLNSGKMEFGLIGGLNTSTLKGMENPSYSHNYGIGMYLDFNLSESWVASVEANLKTTIGANNLMQQDLPYLLDQAILQDAYNSKRNIRLLQVPVFINYRLKNGFGVGVGFYLAYMHSARDYFYLKEKGADIEYKRYFTDQIKKIDAGFVAGIHYHLKGNPGAQIRAKVNYGMVNVFKENNAFGLSETNLWYSFGLAVPIKIKL